MEKIEKETCIKFEERQINQHKELVSLITIYTQVLAFSIHSYNSKSLGPRPHFTYDTSAKDYIEFRQGKLTCHSLAGRSGQKQDIVLSSYCAKEHTLIHEV